MLALRLTRGAQPAVQLRRLLVSAGSAGTGFLLLSALGYALSHPDSPAASTLRLAWCAPPLAATIHLAVAVARTDPGTKPRPGLAAIGLGPGRLMLVSATTTALSCTLGSMLALLVFLHLRGDLTGMPFDGAASQFLAADRPLPLPATLTLLTLPPALASATVAWALRPKELVVFGGKAAGRPYGAHGRFGAQVRRGERGTAGPIDGTARATQTPQPTDSQPTRPADSRPTQPAGSRPTQPARLQPTQPAGSPPTQPADTRPTQPAGSRAAGAAPAPQKGGTPPTPGRATNPPPPAEGTPQTPDALLTPRPAPKGLPWGITILTAGLAMETYANRPTPDTTLTLPTALPTGPTGVLVGWILTALGLALAAPGLTHLCGRLLQSVRPGPLRLLAGRGLMAEATRIGRPLGVVCAVASAVYAIAPLSDSATTAAVGPLSTLGTTVITGCAVATLLMAALEAKQTRADTTAALLRLGAPTSMLRTAAALRVGALLAVFCPLTLIVAELAALPLAR
ncbi:hypothetical protein IM697_35020 [Streptomyces ferrugineus]|uniref:Uncharacterized protein n=1 Tax=Streptomyces ferrugineus TaxID=1413221 RepID=A0A7M2SG15_9ACTN|nr:hypothetical protein [Streptomyces ferrugineus]QOV35244.1 hypothetical protein IM697_35020 [Streptomyces ferrugineus]